MIEDLLDVLICSFFYLSIYTSSTFRDEVTINFIKDSLMYSYNFAIIIVLFYLYWSSNQSKSPLKSSVTNPSLSR